MTDRPVVLATAPFPAVTMAALDQAFACLRLWETPDAADLARVRGIAASTLARPIGDDLFETLPALEIVANFGVGYDNIDVPAALRRGIMVTNTAGVLDEEVADLTLGLMLATVRRIAAADRFVREGQWELGAFPLSPSLRGRRIGIVGMGGIGRAIARRLAGFAVQIAWYARREQPDCPWPRMGSLIELARASDVLIVIVPGGAATRHLIDVAVLDALGPDGVLINVSRGSVVDEAALIAALDDRRILAAGLDVFADEPRVPAALIDSPHTVVLPHVGSASVLTRQAMGQMMVDNLTSWFAGRGALTPIPEISGR